MAAPEIIEPIMMKSSWDCGVASLAILLGHPYREVYEAVLSRYKQCEKYGLEIRQMIGAAKALGHPLVSLPPTDLEDATGILKVKIHSNDPDDMDYHYVVVFNGVVFNPSSGLLYTLDAYLAANHARVLRLLAC